MGWESNINSMPTISEDSSNDGLAGADQLEQPLHHGSLMSKLEPVSIKKLASLHKLKDFKRSHHTQLGVKLGWVISLILQSLSSLPSIIKLTPSRAATVISRAMVSQRRPSTSKSNTLTRRQPRCVSFFALFRRRSSRPDHPLPQWHPHLLLQCLYHRHNFWAVFRLFSHSLTRWRSQDADAGIGVSGVESTAGIELKDTKSAPAISFSAHPDDIANKMAAREKVRRPAASYHCVLSLFSR